VVLPEPEHPAMPSTTIGEAGKSVTIALPL